MSLASHEYYAYRLKDNTGKLFDEIRNVNRPGYNVDTYDNYTLA
jgi:hypothetical protein